MEAYEWWIASVSLFSTDLPIIHLVLEMKGTWIGTKTRNQYSLASEKKVTKYMTICGHKSEDSDFIEGETISIMALWPQ